MLMVQGATSDAGKSVLVAGLGRVLRRRGCRVVPFKPQNMALNSAVTKDGGEIGRAQALQALACGVEASVDMNPVLIKPSSDTGAQIIVRGKVVSAMEAAEFHDFKTALLPTVLQSAQNLLAQSDFVLVEGAGSPAEINLRDRDIANMGFAEAIDCPVIIIADIDRGGVFAHLVGTLELLSKTEQDRVLGFVINKFRGDIKLLQPGLDWLEQRTGKCVFGVLPYLKEFYLDAEDAIDSQQVLNEEDEYLHVVVPVFPRISNHTDFDSLRLHPRVRLEFVRPGATIPPSDMIILPGSKSVRQDLAWMKQQGWDTAVNKHLRYGGKLIGICGGYQMLGSVINDPDGVEGSPGSEQGLGLLPMQTELKSEKQLRKVSGTLALQVSSEREGNVRVNVEVGIEGYEIHCGVSKFDMQQQALVTLDDGRSDGVCSADDQVLGTYLHGLFDCPDVCDAILHWAGLSGHDAPDLTVIREQQLDRLADALEEHLDINKLLSQVAPS